MSVTMSSQHQTQKRNDIRSGRQLRCYEMFFQQELKPKKRVPTETEHRL